METGTMSALLTSVGDVITAALGWFGDVITFLVSQPLLVLMVIAVPLCGYAISKIRSLMSL